MRAFFLAKYRDLEIRVAEVFLGIRAFHEEKSHDVVAYQAKNGLELLLFTIAILIALYGFSMLALTRILFPETSYSTFSLTIAVGVYACAYGALVSGVKATKTQIVAYYTRPHLKLIQDLRKDRDFYRQQAMELAGVST